MSWVDHADAEALAQGVAARLEGLIVEALRTRGTALLALAGGRTPFPAYRRLATQRLDWTRVGLLPTDERWVARGHPARNEDEMAEAFASAPGVNLLSLVPPRAEHPPQVAFARHGLAAVHHRVFDAVVLGMGGDSHTASLFPDSPGLAEAIAGDADEDAFLIEPRPLPKEAPYPRISLGLARLRRTRHAMLVVIGATKRAVVEATLASAPSAARPIGLFLHDPDLDIEIHWSP